MTRNFIRIIICIVSAIILSSTSAFAFSDVNTETDIGKAIHRMEDKGYIQGFPDGTFRPDKTLTRAEFVTILNKMYNYYVQGDAIFSDVTVDSWYYDDVLAAVQAGYIKGVGNGLFKPEDSLTREQVCVMMDRILNTVDLPYSGVITDEVSDWAEVSVKKMLSNRFFVLEDGGKFRGTQPITRGELCVALEKCIVDVEVEIAPVDWQSLEKEVIEKKFTNIIETLYTKIIPYCTHERNITVANMVATSMENYLKIPNYDYVSDAKATYAIYRLSAGTGVELKDLIYENVPVEDIAILFDFFYTPEIDN